MKNFIITVVETGCYGDTLHPRDDETSQWLCDRCFCGNSSDVSILLTRQFLWWIILSCCFHGNNTHFFVAILLYDLFYFFLYTV